jgi:hypothetical protein
MARFEILKIKACVHPQDASRTWLVQIAVDGKPCVPFYDHEARRQRMGEDAWFEALKENAAQLVADYGPQSALT